MSEDKITRTQGASRRQVIRGAALGAAALAVPTVLVPRKTRAAERLVVRAPGGPFEKAFEEAFYKPFKAETGIEVVGTTSGHEPVAEFKALFENKDYRYDVSILGEQAHNTLADAGFLEPLEVWDDPNVQEIEEAYKRPTLVGNDVYATTISYRTDAKLKRNPDGGWKDMWDVEGIPGRRAMRNHPFDTLEIALLADGVDPKSLYPLDLDRAFAALDKIRPHIAVWWTGGAQTSQMLANGEVDICQAWNGRAQAAVDDGAPVAISFTQALIGFEGWSIIKGNPKADLGRQFIKFAARADRQAAYTPYLAYGPTNPNAYKHIDAARAKVLPTNPEVADSLVPVDAQYWSANTEPVLERFKQWMLG